MGSAGFQNQNQARQQGGNVSFAQSLSGSQPTAPLDMSYVLAPDASMRRFRFPSALCMCCTPDFGIVDFIVVLPVLGKPPSA